VLTFRAGVGVLLVAALLVPLVARIRADERLLREHFGAEYDVYYRLLGGCAADLLNTILHPEQLTE
jgi:protein-S-isoprenylcysteine O-methyltransferase Ste14